MSLRRCAVALLFALLASGCGGLIDPSKNTVDTFNGTLVVGGTNTHLVSVGKNGEVSITMTSFTPAVTNGSIGVGIGQVSAGVCAPLAGYVAAGTLNRQVQFGVLNKGDYCVIVYDPGVLVAPTAYIGTFSHP